MLLCCVSVMDLEFNRHIANVAKTVTLYFNNVYVWYFNRFDHKIKITQNIKVVFFSRSRQVLSSCCYVKYSTSITISAAPYYSFLSMFYITENVWLYLSTNPFIIKNYRQMTSKWKKNKFIIEIINSFLYLVAYMGQYLIKISRTLYH